MRLGFPAKLRRLSCYHTRTLNGIAPDAAANKTARLRTETPFNWSSATRTGIRLINEVRTGSRRYQWDCAYYKFQRTLRRNKNARESPLIWRSQDHMTWGEIVVVVSDDVVIDADFACVSVTMPKNGSEVGDDLHLLRRTCEGFARFRRNSEEKTVMSSWERPGSR